MSDWSDVGTALLDELKLNVPGLADAVMHDTFAPWDPEQLTASVDERHFAVWPEGDAAEENTPSVTMAHMLNQSWLVLVWEGAGSEDARQKVERERTLALFDLHNDIRARFYQQANQQLGGSDLVWPVATTFPESTGPVRFFAIRLRVRRSQDFT